MSISNASWVELSSALSNEKSSSINFWLKFFSEKNFFYIQRIRQLKHFFKNTKYIWKQYDE